MALRVALGASRGVLLRQVLLESFIQAAAGGLLGCLLAIVGVRVIPSWLPGFLPDDAFFWMSARMIGFAVALALAAAVVVGLAPALQLARAQPLALLSSGSSRISGGGGSRRLPFMVVAIEVAIALVVAGGAALLTVNTWGILRADPGFDPRQLVMMRLTLPLPKYAGNASMMFFDRLMEEARRLPSVAHVSVSNQPPPGLFSRSQFAIDGRGAGEGSLPSAFFTTAGPTYGDTIGLRLERGRWFDERAGHGGPREVVINDAAARRFFSDEDPVGKRLRIVGPASDGAWAEIVGEAADVRHRGLAADPQPEIIGSVRQIPERRQSQLYLVVRTRGNADTIVDDVRQIVSSIDPQQPLYAITTVEEQYNAGTAQRRLAGRVLIAFSVLALAIAGLGIYGVLSHAVGERTREIGVRLALGAPAAVVRRMVVAQAMLPVGLGIAAGILTLTLGSRAIASWIFGVTAEPGALVLVAAVLGVVGLCASALPAWRASRLNPVVALRTD